MPDNTIFARIKLKAMRKILFTLLFPMLFIFNCSLCFGQSWEWGREAIAKHDSLGGGEIGGDHSIAVDSKGDVYAFGNFGGQIAFGNDTLTASGEDLFLVKYDVNGDFIWVKQIKENLAGGNSSSSVSINNAGEVYVAGYFNDTLSFGIIKLISTSSYNSYIAKYDANGNFIWAKQATLLNNPNSAIYALSLAADNSGNAYVAGLFLDTVFIGSDTLKTSPYMEDFFLAKFNTNGNIVWVKQGVAASSASFNNASSIALDMKDNPFITGSFGDTLIIGRDSLITNNINNGNLFTAKYDSAGNVLWVNSPIEQNRSSFGSPNSISVDRYGDAYVTGYFVDTLIFGTDMLTYKVGYGDVFLVKYNGIKGNASWAIQGKNVGSSSWEGFSVASDTAEGGGYLAMVGQTGPYQITFGKDSFKLNTAFQNAPILLQFDSSGTTICGKIFTEGDEDDGDGIGVGRSGKFVYLGGDLIDTSIFGPDTLPVLANRTELPFIARWKSCTYIPTDISQIKPNQTIAVYPNPFHNSTTIAVNSEGKHNLEIDDITGRKLQWIAFIGKQYELSSLGLTPGMYFVRVFDETNALIGTSKIVVQ